jgi:hypothetical protein
MHLGDSRPRIDDAAAAAGRDPAEVATVYNFVGRLPAAHRVNR